MAISLLGEASGATRRDLPRLDKTLIARAAKDVPVARAATLSDPRLLKHSREFSYRRDTDGRLTFVSDQATAILGYSAAELCDESAKLLSDHAINGDALHHMALALSTGHEQRPYLAEFLHKSGTRIWVELAELPEIADGHVTGITGVARVVTEQMRKRAELVRTRLRYRRLLDAAPIAIALVDLDGDILESNPALERLVGRPMAQLRGASLRSLSHADDVDFDETLIAELSAGSRDSYVCERRFAAGDGSYAHILLAMSLVRDERQWPAFFMATLQDVTSLRAAEARAREAAAGLRRSLMDTVHALASTVEQRDRFIGGHQKRVAKLTSAIAARLGLTETQVRDAEVAAALHDIGKIAVPAEIMSYPGKLNSAQLALIQQHVLAGYEILKPISDFNNVAEIVLQHHERLDGSGYPRALKGDAICVEARIVAVADVVEAIMSHRPHRPARDRETALSEVASDRDTLYDGAAIDACAAVLRDPGFTF